MSSNSISKRDQEIFSEQVKLLYEQTKSEIKTNPFPPLIIFLVFYSYVDHAILISWLVAIEASIFYKVYLLPKYQLYAKSDVTKWVHRVTIGNTLHCLLASMLFLSLDLDENYLLAVVYSGVLLILSAIMVHILASVPRIYLFCSIAIHVPVAIKSFLAGTPAFYLLGIAYLTGCVQFILLNRNIYNTIRESIILRFEKNDLIEELEQKRQDAERANTLKTRFLASASHDLRQPLHTMNLFIDILQGKSITKEQKQIIEKIQSSNDALIKILNTLLDISKMDAKTIEVNSSHFSIDKLFSSLATDLTPLANRKNLILKFSNPDHCVVFSDLFHVNRILRNLTDNAIKYTNEGEVHLTCQANGDGTVTLRVNDTGPGIPPDKHEEIFSEFYQLHNPERDRRQGLGLGLSIVRRLCEMLGSGIKLDARENHGSSFYFKLPQGDASRIELERNAEQPVLSIQLTVLVIDDEPEILDAMSTLLKSWGCIVEVAETKKNALTLLKEKAYRPMIVISDFRLRDLETGIEAIDAIRSALNSNDLPAIVLTGDTTPEVIELCRKKNLLLLYKPIKPAKLLSTLNYCIKNQIGQNSEPTSPPLSDS